MGEQAHQLSIEGLDMARNNPVASLLSQGLSAGLLEHRPIGTSFSCSNACLEQLLKVQPNTSIREYREPIRVLRHRCTYAGSKEPINGICKSSLALQEALLPLEGNYTAAEQPFKGIVALRCPTGAAPVELSLRQTAGQAWATEMALLHASGMSLDAQAANQCARPANPAWFEICPGRGSLDASYSNL